MKKFSLLALLLVAGAAYGQGTQISGSQIKDGAITNAKINSDAAISYTKLDFTGMPASIVNASNPLTFNTPLSKTSNAISLNTVPVTFGGTGLTSIVAGRLLFGGNSTTIGTSANLTFDLGTNLLTVIGKGHFTSDFTVDGTFTVNGKTYTWPSAFGSGFSGYVLTDVAGNGTLSWEVPASSGVTLQTSDPPSTQDTGGFNISGKGFIGDSLHMQGNSVYFNTSPTDLNDYVLWNNTVDRMQVFGYAGAEIGSSLIGTAAISVRLAPGAATSIIHALDRFSDITSGNLLASPLATGAAPTVTTVGATGAETYAYVVRALLADGSGTLGGLASTTAGNAVLDDINYVNITWGAVPGAVAYDVYRETATGTPNTTGKINNTPIYDLVLDDTGLAGAGGADPLDNTGVVKGTYFATTLGTNVTTGATVLVPGSVFHITDAATPIQYLTPPTGFIGAVTIIPDATFTTITGGNIILGSTAVVGKALIMTYDGTSWYPSY